jgi:hypothetical protein
MNQVSSGIGMPELRNFAVAMASLCHRRAKVNVLGVAKFNDETPP